MERRGFRTTTALVGLLACAAGQTQAQGTPEPWTARVSYGREVFDSDLPAWSDWETLELSAGRRWTSGSLMAGVSRTQRFDLEDPAAFVDAYRTLWRNAYGNLRIQVAPDAAVIPRTDVGGEVFQGFGRGWEASLGARHMAFATTTVNIGALSLGRFVGRWFARGRLTQPFTDVADGETMSVSGLLRRQLDERQGFVEVSAGTGGEAVTTAASSVDVRSTSFVAAGGQKYVTRHWGAALSLSTVSFQGIPRRTGGTIGLLVRW